MDAYLQKMEIVPYCAIHRSIPTEWLLDSPSYGIDSKVLTPTCFLRRIGWYPDRFLGSPGIIQHGCSLQKGLVEHAGLQLLIVARDSQGSSHPFYCEESKQGVTQPW